MSILTGFEQCFNVLTIATNIINLVTQWDIEIGNEICINIITNMHLC
jgi:hypothetical protein